MEGDSATSRAQMLADSVVAIKLDTQQAALESQYVPRERSFKKLEKPEDSVLDGNIQDLSYLETRIEEFAKPSGYPILLDEGIPWTVSSVMLQAVFCASTQRRVGGALVQYIYARRMRTDLTDSLKNHEFQIDLKRITYSLKKLVIIEKIRTTTSAKKQSDKMDEREYIVTLKDMLTVLVRSCRFQGKNEKTLTSTHDRLDKKMFQDIGFALCSTDSIEFIKGKPKTNIEKLFSSALTISLTLRKDIVNLRDHSILREIGTFEKSKSLKEMVEEIVKLARGLKSSCKEHEEAEIENAVKEVILETLNLLDVSDQLGELRQNVGSHETPNLKRQQSEQVKHLDSLPVVGRSKSLVFTRSRSPSPPRSKAVTPSVIGAIGAGVSGVAGGILGAFSGGLLGARIGASVGSMGYSAVASAVATGRQWNPFAKESMRSEVKPTVTSSSYKPVECVATPFSDPVYLKGGGGGSSGGGGDDSDDGGGYGGDGGGGGGGGEGSTMPERDRYQEYSRQYLDACRSLTDAINDLCRITSHIHGIQNDCREMLQKLEFHGAMLECGQPTTAFSYAECLEELLKMRESIVLLNNDQPMVRIEFFRTLRFIVSAVCKTLDLAAQSMYLLTLQDCDQAAAKLGVVDVRILKKTVEAAQFSCFKMMQFSPELAREEAVELRKQIEDLLAALADAGRRSLNMKERIEGAATDVQHSTAELDVTLQHDDRESITTAIIRLLISIKRVGALAEDPDIVPVAANTSQAARERRRDVLLSAKNLKEKITILVNEAMAHENLGDDSRPMTWSSGRIVTREFEELLGTARKNGNSAGFIEDTQKVPEVATAGASKAVKPTPSAN